MKANIKLLWIRNIAKALKFFQISFCEEHTKFCYV